MNTGFALVALLVLALGLATTLIASPFAGAGQLLVNGGFEGQYDQNGLAPHWKDNSYSSKGPIEVTYACETVDPRRGEACQRITCTRIGFLTAERRGHAFHGAVQMPAIENVSLRKGAVYRVGASLRADASFPIEVLLRMRAEPWTRYVAETVVGRSEWRDVDYLFTSHVDDPEAAFFIRTEYMGTLWVDDASVEELTPEQLAETTAPVVPGNLLQNGGFDLERANWSGERGWDTVHDARFTVDTLDGNPCLKATIPAPLKKAIVSDTVAVAPGHPIRVSCRVRAAAPTEVTLGAHYQASRAAMPAYCKTTREVGPQWQTLAAEGQVPFRPGQPHAFVYLLFTGPGPLWVDDAVLCQDGDEAPTAVTHAAIIADRYPWGLYHDGEPTNLRILASVPPGSKPTLRWRLEDHHGEIVRSGQLQPGEGQTLSEVALPNLPRGYYHARIEWRHGDREFINESTFCRLPPSGRTGDPATSPFGAHFMVSPLHTSLVEAIGARWIRLWPPGLTLWQTIEPDRGKREWRDAEVQRLVDEGFLILGMLESPPSWAKWGEPGYWEAWESYVADVVERYKEEIHVWEVQNEPNLRWWMETTEGARRADLHIEALQHTYPVIKRVDPTATVVGCCVAGDFAEGTDPYLFTREIIERGALELMDVLSFHYYHSYAHPLPMDEEPDLIAASTAHMKQIMREAGRELPIINSEGGTYNPAPVITYRPCAPDNYDPIPGEEVARLLVRQYVAQWAAGVERFFYYNCFVNGTPAARAWDSFVEGDGQPRPAVAAYATMTWLLDGATFDHTERPTLDLWLHHFRTPRGRLVVAWTRTGTEVEHVFATATQAWDIMGREVELEATRLTLTPEPSYVLLAG